MLECSLRCCPGCGLPMLCMLGKFASSGMTSLTPGRLQSECAPLLAIVLTKTDMQALMAIVWHAAEASTHPSVYVPPGELFSALGQLPFRSCLRELIIPHLDAAVFVMNGATQFWGFDRLEELCLDGVRVERKSEWATSQEAGLVSISRLPRLRKLALRCSHLPPPEVPFCRGGFASLQELRISCDGFPCPLERIPEAWGHHFQITKISLYSDEED
ncbi:hypothetical protein WJX72_007165 [[Myrmecia] bisecta]|uniref:Uncharacterized protein n=1 Tax=[Myrmecia] bisecta TaxID=41462 RepID=A0AAW1QRH7_9CHLO